MTEALMVNLGQRSYSIHFGASLQTDLRPLLDSLAGAGGRKFATVTDSNVAILQKEGLQALPAGSRMLVLVPGEVTKSLATFGRILDFLAEQRLDRSSGLFAVGGGVVGDLTGFAAASYLRGIDYFQVPTTLLAMVDSSVGGKTGINLAAGKNLAGAFHQPRGVFVATDFLATLPPREFAAGMAEVIKCGLLADAGLFARLEPAPLSATSGALAPVIRRCCEIKARIVEADEREEAPEGGRALLNLGHTFAHAIEQATGYASYLHGEAVAVGLVAAARLSQGLGHLGTPEVARVEAVLAAHGLPTRLAGPLPIPMLVEAMGHDKKVRAGRPRFVVLRRIGEAVTQANIDPALAVAAWRAVGAA